MGMFGPKMGTWWVSSKLDPRWNKVGRGYGSITSGKPKKLNKWIEQCMKSFGDPPADAKMGFMKE